MKLKGVATFTINPINPAVGYMSFDLKTGETKRYQVYLKPTGLDKPHTIEIEDTRGKKTFYGIEIDKIPDWVEMEVIR